MRCALAVAVFAGLSLLASEPALGRDDPLEGLGKRAGRQPSGSRGFSPKRPDIGPSRAAPRPKPATVRPPSGPSRGGTVVRPPRRDDGDLSRGHRVSPGRQSPKFEPPPRTSPRPGPTPRTDGIPRRPRAVDAFPPRPGGDDSAPGSRGAVRRGDARKDGPGVDRSGFFRDRSPAEGRRTPPGATGRGGAVKAPDADRTRVPGFGRDRTSADRRPGAGALPGTSLDRRFGPGGTVDRGVYRSAWRNGHRVADPAVLTASSTWSGRHHRPRYHDWYDRHHWYLSFHFGASCGSYFGVSYYHPFHSWTLGVDLAFFYPAPVTWCYAPFGFYWDYAPVYVTRYAPVYVTRYEVVRETVPVYVYEKRTVVTVEEADAEAGPAEEPAADAEAKVAEPKPAAGSPATEKFLREASELFRAKDYYEAAVKFRLAALSSPDLPGPLFALGQSLIALGHDEYAARVLRKAVLGDPRLLEETGDIVGVYESQEEFDRVTAALEKRAEAAPAGGDARFLLGFQRYFAGDVRCRETFRALDEALPEDQVVSLFRTAVEMRFKGADDLPPLPAR